VILIQKGKAGGAISKQQTMLQDNESETYI